MIILYRKEDGRVLTSLKPSQSLDLLLENYPPDSVSTLDVEFDSDGFKLLHQKVDLTTLQLVSIFS